MRSRPGPRAVLPAFLVAVAVLLAGCDQAEPFSAACKVEVDTGDLQQERTQAGIPDCDPERAGTDAGEPADLPDVDLPCLGSEATMSLSEVTGPAIINFWASNCGPCRKEMPALAEFQEQYGDQVPVLGVDYLETYPSAALELAADSGTNYPSLADPCGELQQTDLVIQGLPVFLFVRADGSVERTTGGVETLAEVVEKAESNLDVDLDAGATR
ncbi:TlpA family protein disulfide reductase [Nocardioides panacisoli]|uniref:TlpA family protein disulfide reductase n=1 Tax=Nocardioides panacisoli TaxID=627624 RepID=UPI001C639111|nr:TlpA disulfide reductase family protein [Nocardioides panacisoli]QYJ03704.1 TlpA family protein disulfide reductase [Nocardioides panacisoli]